MSLVEPLSEYAQAVYEELLATAEPDTQGRLVSTVALYRFLEDRFGLHDPQSRRVRGDAVRELAGHGLVRRHNVRGRVVELLVAADDGALLSYEDYAASIGGDGDVEEDLDVTVPGRRRREQAFLRQFLLAQRTSAPCAFCGRALPADLLVAAHLQRRAELTRSEKLNFAAIAVLACTLGCDSLYEQGYLGVDQNGRLITAAVPPGPLAEHLLNLQDRSCESFTQARAPYFAHHCSEHFRSVTLTAIRQEAGA